MRILLGVCLIACVLACNANRVAVSGSAVTYNGDSRQQYYEASPAWRAVADRTAIMVNAENIRFDTAGTRTFQVAPQTLGASMNLCEDQLFRNEPTAGSCSGTLVGPRHILTAGHCVSRRGCTNMGWIFGFQYDSDGQLRTAQNDDIYVCRNVLARSFRGIDYAVLELDRDVVGRTPAMLETTERPTVGDAVALIGYPSGLPMKIDVEGVVTDATSSQTSFGATVDAFGGNSGSGVFNAEGHVVGVLTEGERDYIARGSCVVVNDIACANNICGGENVERATAIFLDACARGVSLFGTCPVIEAGVDVGVGDASTGNRDARIAGDASVGDGSNLPKLGGGGCSAASTATSRVPPTIGLLLLASAAFLRRRRL